ncbi:MAG: pyridoxal phosphate-dependent aminotransferase family protein [Bdellovibrionaceae bacterium]|nr:pyridoxal phosphate-dependent aminotransferase family protein [Bdellovibrionales bacterium]MCB9084230.1 pyridoxal phosphate-dependent aminotransferase family protein [Pseudobdellovibrionaceae bacterium]
MLNEEFWGHLVQLKSVTGDSPLARLTNQHLASSELRRTRFLARFLDGFHLKNCLISDVDGRQITLDGKRVVNFASANYLGLEQHPQVKSAVKAAVDRLGTHSGCSRIFASHTNIVRLEQEISKMVGAEKTLICANTSHTHQGVISSLFTQPNTTLFLDRFAHTSLYQAALIAKAKGARLIKVDIRNEDELIENFQKHGSHTNALLIDGVYSMSGEIPRLKWLNRVCQSHQVILYVDDAHGIGIMGETGGGVAEEFNLDFSNMILVGGLQKGMGSYGGFVSGQSGFIDLMRVTNKAYIFSGTLQPHAVAGALAAIEISQSQEGRRLRSRLKEISLRVRRELWDMGFDDVPGGDTPIIPVPVGGDVRTLMAGRKLLDLGVYVNSVLFPAVPKGQGILRLSLSATHEDAEVYLLLQALRDLKSEWDSTPGWKENLGYMKVIASRQWALHKGSRGI